MERLITEQNKTRFDRLKLHGNEQNETDAKSCGNRVYIFHRKSSRSSVHRISHTMPSSQNIHPSNLSTNALDTLSVAWIELNPGAVFDRKCSL